MGRFLKWLVGGLFSLVFLVGLLIFLLVTFVDLNSLKPRLETLAKEQAKIDLNIAGDLSWSFFPYLGIELGEIQVRPLATPNARPLASIQEAAVGVAVIPLLKGEVKIDRLHLIQPKVYLHRNTAGIANWELVQEGLVKNPSEAEVTTNSTPAESIQPEQATPATTSPLELNLAIADIWLDRAEVQIQDEIDKLDVQLTDVSIRAKNVSLTQAFPLELAAKLSLAKPKTNLDLNLSSHIKLDLNAQHYGLDQLKIKLIAAYPEVLKTPATLTLEGKVDAQMASGEVKLPLTLALSAPDWVDASLPKIAATQLALDANLDLNKQLYLLNKLQLNTSLALDKKQKMLPLSLQVTGEADLEKQLATLNQQLSLNEFQQTLNIKASELLEALKFSGVFNIEVSQLRKLLTDLGIELPAMADITTLGQLITNLGFEGNLNKLAVNQIQLQLDETELKGQAEVNLQTLAVFLRLTGNALDADRYLPPPLTEKETAATKAQAATQGSTNQSTATNAQQQAANDEELLPVELLKELNLDIGFNLAKLKISGLKLEKINLGLTAKDGLIDVQRANLDLYQGTFRNQAQIDVRKAPAKLSLTTDLKNLNLRPLLDDLEKESLPLRGKLNFAGDFTTQGTRLSEWLAYSNGPGKLRMINGAVTGINLSKEVCVAAATIDGRTSNKQWSEDTEFTNLSADVKLVNGQLNNQDLKLGIPGFEVSGYGFYHLVAADFLYNLGIRFSEDADQHSCPVNSTLAKIRWPVECKGSLAEEKPKISCKADTQAVTRLVGQMAKEAAKQEANRIKEQAKEKAKQEVKAKADEQKSQLKEEASKKIRSLFK